MVITPHPTQWFRLKVFKGKPRSQDGTQEKPQVGRVKTEEDGKGTEMEGLRIATSVKEETKEKG